MAKRNLSNHHKNRQIFFLAIFAAFAVISANLIMRNPVFFSGKAASTTPVACPIAQDTSKGRYVVKFPGGFVRADTGISDSKLGSFSTNVPAGAYKVTLYSYDADHTATNTQVQPNESWYAQMKNGSADGEKSAALGDLPDKELWKFGVVNSSLSLAKAVTSVTAVHAGYPDAKKNANSVTPVCVVFEPAGPAGVTSSCNYVEIKAP